MLRYVYYLYFNHEKTRPLVFSILARDRAPGPGPASGAWQRHCFVVARRGSSFGLVHTLSLVASRLRHRHLRRARTPYASVDGSSASRRRRRLSLGTWRPAATETGVLKKYAELMAVGAAVRRDSVSSRWRFNMQKGSFESGKELGN